jgi:hypothetical protein
MQPTFVLNTIQAVYKKKHVLNDDEWGPESENQRYPFLTSIPKSSARIIQESVDFQ